MKQNEIIEMAVQAGMAKEIAEVNIDIVEAFAKLVAAKALADPMREVQRLGQEIEQEPRTEQNFCPRCGKRTKDMTHIHTCTPPKENT